MIGMSDIGLNGTGGLGITLMRHAAPDVMFLGISKPAWEKSELKSINSADELEVAHAAEWLKEQRPSFFRQAVCLRQEYGEGLARALQLQFVCNRARYLHRELKCPEGCCHATGHEARHRDAGVFQLGSQCKGKRIDKRFRAVVDSREGAWHEARD